MKTKTITPEQKEEAKIIYNTYFKDFNYALDQKKKLVNKASFYFDIHRQSDAINTVIDFICTIEGKYNILAYVLGDKLIEAKNTGSIEDRKIRQCFDIFSLIINIVSYREELFILQDILNRKTELIRDIEEDSGIS